ncbi:MAG: radical SAM protein [Candidatus Eisenbacteria bacterium]|nr:radical SAM protein [Candidatus Eisenbacteria bacterium]
MAKERRGRGDADRRAILNDERIYGGAEYRSGDLRVVFAYPNRYGVGMSNLGYQSILARARASELVEADRLFAPEGEGAPLRTLDGDRPAADAHLLAFSVSFENDYVHLLRTLRAAGLPLRREERDERAPLVAVGGAITFLNPEPLRPFVDLFFLGEGEELFPEYLDLLREDRAAPRRDHLERAARVPGVYAPAILPGGGGAPRRAYGRFTEDPPATSILTPRAEFRDTLLVEISRGCPRGCRYCSMRALSPEYRTVPAERVVALADRYAAEDRKRGRAPLRRIGLVSAAFFDHPGADRMIDALADRGFLVTVSSLRVERTGEGALRRLRESGLRTLTVAPEAATDRLRRVIGRPPSEEEILAGVDRAARAGFRSLRLYFMVGLPTETEEDREAIAPLVRIIASRFRAAGGGEIAVSLHPFVPKPRTPFQWSAMTRPESMRAILARLRSRLAGFPVKAPAPKEVYMEGLLARTGEEAGLFLERLAEGLPWRRAAAEAGIDLEETLFTDRPAGAGFPWEGAERDPAAERRLREWTRAVGAKGTGE